MSWEVFGHSPPPRSKWALPCAGLLFIGALALGQGLASARADRLLGPEVDTPGWAIRFSEPAFMQSDRTESVIRFLDASQGSESPTIRIVRLDGDPTSDIERFCSELWQKLFGPLVPGGQLVEITIGGQSAWEVIGPGGDQVMRVLTVSDSETYAFAYTAGRGSTPERSRAQFDALCDSVRLHSPE